MALGDRSVDLILKAQVDQALQPLAQVVQRVKDLVAVLDTQRDAAAKGDTTLAAYTKALRDVQAASGDLLKAREALNAFQVRQETLDTRQSAVDTKRAARDTFEASLPDASERTTKQDTALKRLNTSLAASERQAGTAAVAYQKAVDQLQRMGVLTDQLAASQQRLRLDQAQATISAGVLQSSSALAPALALNDRLIETLKLSGIEKQVAEQRARDTAKFLADEEREVEAIRAKGRAAQEEADRQGPLNIRRFEVEQAFRDADAAAAAAKEAGNAAKALREEQDNAQRSARALWDAEVAGAEKARLATEAFRASVAEAGAQARAALANAATQAGVLGTRAPLPAPTLAQTVRETLATPPGGATGAPDFNQIQLQVEGLNQIFISGGGTLASYTNELRALDAAEKEIGRQAQIIDGFTKADTAARTAVTAFRDAILELRRLEDAAHNATEGTKELSEVTSKIAQQNRAIGSVDAGTGLAAKAREAQIALEQERQALLKIGVTTSDVGDAQTALTVAARTASAARGEIYIREQREIQDTIAAATTRVASLSTTALTPTASARSAVAAVAGAGRGSGEITDITAATDKLDAAVGKASLTAQTFNKRMDELFAIQRQVASDAGLIDNFNAQVAAVTRADAAYRAAQAELARVVVAARDGTASLTELRRAEASLTGAASDLARQAGLQAQLDAQLKARRIDTANLTAETNRMVASSQRLEEIQTRANQGKGTVFGLSSYQLQNLSFQVNDVITQLSLGQGVLRTLESQGGQIGQIFETSITAMKRLVLFGLPAIAIIGTLVLALQRVNETATAQRAFAGALAGTADGAGRSSVALVNLARELERNGVAFADATATVKTFLDEGLDNKRIEQFSLAAQNLARGLGVPIADAAKSLAEIPTASLEGLQKLLLSYHVLTPALQEYITQQARSGNIDLARVATFDALAARAKAAATEGVGPLTASMDSLKNAWHDFLDALATNDELETLLRQLKETLAAAKAAVDFLNRVQNSLRITPVTRQPGDVGYLPDVQVAKTKLAVEALEKKILELNQIPVGLTTEDARRSRFINVLNEQLIVLKKAYEDAIVARDKLASGEIVPGAGPVVAGAQGGAAGAAVAAAQTHTGQTLGQVGAFLGPQNTDAIVNAWCAAFANAALAAAGLPGSGSNLATSFLNYGKAVADGAVQRGDVLVMSRGHPAGEAGGHVGLATGVTKTGPSGAILVEMVSGNMGGRVSQDFIDRRELTIRRPPGAVAGAAPFVPPAPGSTLNVPADSPEGIAANLKQKIAVQDKIDAEINASLLGNSQAKIDSDEKIANARQRQAKKEADDIRGNAAESTANELLRAQEDFKFRENQKAARDKEDAVIRTRIESEVTSANDRLLTDATDPVAARKKAADAFVHSLADMDAIIASGVTQSGGKLITDVIAGLKKAQADAAEQAGIAADVLGAETLAKARDAQVAKIAEDTKTGAITVQQAFDLLAKVIANFGPRIKAAVDLAQADLARQPVTPKIQAAQATLGKISIGDQASLGALDQAGLTQINQLLAARDDLAKTYNDLVTQGVISQRQADAQTRKAYDDAKPALNALLVSLREQIELQNTNGEITPATYAKISAQIDLATAKSNDLIASQKKMATEIDNVIETSGVAAFDSITTGIGAAIAGTESWGDALKNVGTAFAQMAASILKGIAEIIIKQEILNALQQGHAAGGGVGNFISALFSGGGGAGGAAGAAGAAGSAAAESAAATSYGDALIAFASAAHSGGVVGATNLRRPVNPAAFFNAVRAHSGGMVGLSRGEVPMILQQGEEVLTSKDPRHRSNFSGNAPVDNTPTSVRNVILFDDSQVAGAMSGAHGEKVLFSFLKRNAPAVRQLVGGK